MTDFRQNVGDINTAASAANYSGIKTSAVAIGLEGIADAFTGYMQGQQNAAAAQYRARADAREERSAQMQEQKFFDTEQQQSAENLVAFQQATSGVVQLQDTMARMGVTLDDSAIPVGDLSNNQVRALNVAANSAQRMEGMLSQSERDSFKLDFARAAQYAENVKRYPEMARHFAAIFKQDTGKDFIQYVQGMQDTMQHPEIARAEAAEKQLADFRAKYDIDPSVSDIDVRRAMATVAQQEEETRLLARKQAQASYQGTLLSNQRARIDINQPAILQRYMARIAQGASAVYSSAMQGLTSNWTTAPGAADPLTQTNFMHDVRQQMADVQAEMYAAGATPETVRAAMAPYEQLYSQLPDMFSGKMSAERARAQKDILTDSAMNELLINDPNALTLFTSGTLFSAIPDQVLVGQMGARLGKDLLPTAQGALTAAANPRPGSRPSVFNRFSLTNSVAAGSAGNPHPAVTLSRDAPAAELSQADASFATFTGAMLLGNPNNSANVDQTTNPFSDLQLGGNGRSIKNVPLPLLMNANIDPTIRDRLNMIMPSLAALDWNSDISRTAPFEKLMEVLADPAAAASVHIDPRILRAARQNTITYIGRMAEAATQDLLSTRGAAGGQRYQANGMGGVFPVTTGGYSTDHGIRTQIDREGRVTFQVNPNLPVNEQIEASKVARVFNTRYAPRLTTTVRTYANLFQADDLTNYDRAFAAVLNAGYSVDPNDEVEAAVSELANHADFKDMPREDIRRIVIGAQNRNVGK